MLQIEAWRPGVTRTPASAISPLVPDPFERLFLEEYPRVVAIAYRVLADRSAAEDVAQDVFLKFHRRLSAGDERAARWLHAAAVHSALNVDPCQRRRTPRQTAQALPPGPGAGVGAGRGLLGGRPGWKAGFGVKRKGGGGGATLPDGTAIPAGAGGGPALVGGGEGGGGGAHPAALVRALDRGGHAPPASD